VKFKSIPETVKKISKLLKDKGVRTYNNRTKSWTKEIIGVSFETSINGFGNFLKKRIPADLEIESAFIKALEIIFKDNTARYAVGYPNVFPKGRNPPCISLVQILLRKNPIILVYFRSMNIKELPYDLSSIAKYCFHAFGKGSIKCFIGSLHKNIKYKRGK